MKHVLNCPYCGDEAALVTGEAVYPHRSDLHHKKFYMCAPCEAYVGCHPGSTRPLGRLANAELRKAKMSAHAAFDPMWRSGEMSRAQAYAWLSEALGIDSKDAHIGMFDTHTCNKLVSIIEGFNK